MAADRSPGGGVERCWFARAVSHSGISACDKLAHRRGRAPRIVRHSQHVFSQGRARRAGACLFQRHCFSATSARRRESVVSRRFCASGLANASPSQTDDIRAHRQQNGDAYRDNDQEEFAHCSVSRRSQRQAAGIVLSPQAERSCVRKGPPSRRAFGSQGGTAIRLRRRNSR